MFRIIVIAATLLSTFGMIGQVKAGESLPSLEKSVSYMSEANLSYWQQFYSDDAAEQKFHLHRKICLENPQSKLAMNPEQRSFYCSISLHFRMCNTLGLYRLGTKPDSPERRNRENKIFAACLELSGEKDLILDAFKIGDIGYESATSLILEIYDEYKVKPGVHIPPADQNAIRRFFKPLERLLVGLFYGTVVPIEIAENILAKVFHRGDTDALEAGQVEEVLRYYHALRDYNGEDLLLIDW